MMVLNDTQKNDIVTAIKNWNEAFKEPLGIEALAKAMAELWGKQIWMDDFRQALEEMVSSGLIADEGHWCYVIK